MVAPFTFQRRFGDAAAGELAPPLVGPEDLELDLTNPAEPSLLVSCQKRPKEDVPGFIARVVLGPDGPVSWRRLELRGRPEGDPFHPLGLSLCGPDRLLYVVNKDRKNGSRIEVFDLGPQALDFRQRLIAPEFLTDPNDLAALPGGRVFVSNTHGRAGTLRNALSDLLKAKNGSLVAREEGQWRTVAGQISFANGVAADAAGTLYVTSTRAGALETFTKEDGTWTPDATLDVGGQPDNLTWADERFLVVASHKSLAAFLAHASTGGATRSGAQVLRVDTRARPFTKELLLDHDGSGISAISTAILFQDRLYLGQVIGNGIGVAVRASS
jgi:hypothetical protein